MRPKSGEEEGKIEYVIRNAKVQDKKHVNLVRNIVLMDNTIKQEIKHKKLVF